MVPFRLVIGQWLLVEQLTLGKFLEENDPRYT